MNIWSEYGVPTKTLKNCIVMLRHLWTEWKDLQKSEKKTKGKLIVKKATFNTKITELFDIAHVEALSRIEDEDLQQFLASQRQDNRLGLSKTILRQSKVEQLQPAVNEDRSQTDILASDSVESMASTSKLSDTGM